MGVGSVTLATVSLVLAVGLSDKVHAKRLFGCSSVLVLLLEAHHELPSLGRGRLVRLITSLGLCEDIGSCRSCQGTDTTWHTGFDVGEWLSKVCSW